MKGLRPGWAVKAIVVVIFTSMFFRCVSAAAAPATNHSVGGASGWDLSSNLQAWATRVTFHVGDSLVFRYTPVHDLLEVNKMEYDLCHTVDPIETHSDGETVITLVQAGHRYFMCGRAGHCAMGLKLHVHVIPTALTTSPAPPNTTSSSGNATSSSPEASPITSPAPDQAVGNLVPASPPMQPAVSANTSVNSSAAPGRGGNATTSDANKNLNVDRTWLALLIVVVLIMQSWSPLFSTISLLLVFMYNWVHMRRQ